MSASGLRGPAAPGRWELAALALLALAWLGVASRQLELPGLCYDEAYNPLHAMEALLDMPARSPWTLRIGSRDWPLLSDHPYDLNGLDIHLAALAFWIGGIGVEPLRWLGLFFTGGIILLFYGTCRLLFPARVARLALALAAASPLLLLWGRMAFFAHMLFITFFAAAAFFCFAVWRRRPGALWAFYLSAFFLGFSLNVSVKALVYILPFPAAFFLLVPPRERPALKHLAGAALLAAAAAASPILYNVTHGFPTVRTLLGSLAAPVAAADNWALGRNILTRLAHVVQGLDGTTAAASVSGTPVPDRLAAAVFWAGLAWLAWSAFRDRGEARRRARGTLLLFPLMFVPLLFTPKFHDPIHILVLWPYPCLVSALLLDKLFGLSPKRFWKPAALALLALLLSLEARVTAVYFSDLRRTGGTGFFTDAVNGLAEHLDRRAPAEVICLSFGIAKNVRLLTQGRVRARDGHHFRAGVSPELLDQYRRWAADPDALFVSVDEAFYSQGRDLGYYAAFDRVLRETGRRRVLEASFPDRSGRAYYLVHRVVGPGGRPERP